MGKINKKKKKKRHHTNFPPVKRVDATSCAVVNQDVSRSAIRMIILTVNTHFKNVIIM